MAIRERIYVPAGQKLTIVSTAADSGSYIQVIAGVMQAPPTAIAASATVVIGAAPRARDYFLDHKLGLMTWTLADDTSNLTTNTSTIATHTTQIATANANITTVGGLLSPPLVI